MLDFIQFPNPEQENKEKRLKKEQLLINLGEHKIFRFNEEDSQRFMEDVINPPEVDEKLKAFAKNCNFKI